MPNAAANTRHWRFNSGSNSRGASSGLITSVRPMATPANHSDFLVPCSNQRKNSTSSSSTTPLMLVKTSVLVTLSVQNMASSSAGAATEASVKLNSRSRK
ncbi:Uncharacterised protein [Mycobacteroides abscessus subsp. abscessus]|nr:Uncharacterised protein [Mycobacteroides abscessus subsp. abscessus]